MLLREERRPRGCNPERQTNPLLSLFEVCSFDERLAKVNALGRIQHGVAKRDRATKWNAHLKSNAHQITASLNEIGGERR